MPLHTTVQLDEWARTHLAYEVQQLAGAAVALSVDGIVMTSLNTHGFVKCALLESFLMHVRTIDDFLRFDHGDETKPTKRRDVLAVDYLPAHPCRGAVDEPDRRDINAQLAHVSVDRVPGRLWPVAALAEQVVDTFAKFADAVVAAPQSERHISNPSVLSAITTVGRDLLDRIHFATEITS